jgi:RNA polymerase sigma-70 factor (ECF subfamily)
MSYSEKELIEKLIVDDIDAFRQIFERNYKPLVKYARRFVMDIDAAEDITQQTFLYIWEKRRTINIGQALKSYLFRAVHNACINHLKRENRMEEYTKSFILDTNDQYNETGFNYTVQNEIKHELESAIDSLPENCKNIFKLSRFKGLKNREIALELSISIRTVETQIYRALKILKERLSEHLVVSSLLLLFFYHL